ncbi:unnamed protein product [Rhodiola kirilowii]
MVSAGAMNVTPLCCCAQSSNRPGLVNGNISTGQTFIRANKVSANKERFRSLEVKATNDNKTIKVRSIVCAKCEGNGAVVCSQCKGTGVNSEDHFNGRFKAGAICWLCR